MTDKLLSEEQIKKVIIQFMEDLGEPTEVATTAALMWDIPVTQAILQAQLSALAPFMEARVEQARVEERKAILEQVATFSPHIAQMVANLGEQPEEK